MPATVATISGILGRCLWCPEPQQTALALRSGNVARLCIRCHEREASQRHVVYFFRCLDRVKIGYSATVHRRLRAIQTGAPYPVELWFTIEGDRDLEAELHGLFSGSRVHGEWFQITPAITEFVAANGGAK